MRRWDHPCAIKCGYVDGWGGVIGRNQAKAIFPTTPLYKVMDNNDPTSKQKKHEISVVYTNAAKTRTTVYHSSVKEGQWSVDEDIDFLTAKVGELQILLYNLCQRLVNVQEDHQRREKTWCELQFTSSKACGHK